MGKSVVREMTIRPVLCTPVEEMASRDRTVRSMSRHEGDVLDPMGPWGPPQSVAAPSAALADGVKPLLLRVEE